MIITEAYAIAKANTNVSQPKVKKPSSPSLIKKITGLIKTILTSFRSTPSKEETEKEYKIMCDRFIQKKLSSPITKEQFNEIFTAYKKNGLNQSDTTGIVRAVKGKPLPRPVLTTDNNAFILFTKLQSKGDPFIGKGADSVVKLAYNLKDHSLEALNITKDSYLEDNQKNRSRLERPVAIMKKVGAAFAPKVHASLIQEWKKDGEKGLKRYVVNTLYEGSLSKLLNEKDNALKLDAIEQILKILVELQKKGIVHCDIKPENFVFRRNGKGIEVKQIDNDRSFDLQEKASEKNIGTVCYSAPEILNDVSSQSHASDVYSAMMSIMYFWGYKDMFNILNEAVNTKISEEDTESIGNLVPEFKGVNPLKLKQFAGLLCLQPGWFNPAEGDVLGQILKKGLDPDPSKRQSAEVLLIEIEERREQILKSAEKKAEAVFSPTFKINYFKIKQGLKKALNSLKQ